MKKMHLILFSFVMLLYVMLLASCGSDECKTHTEETKGAVEATCETEGNTGVKFCSVCGVIIEGANVIPATGHTEVTLPAKEATCTESGLTEGKSCSVCNKVITAQIQISAKGHKQQIMFAKAPTCTEEGYDDWKTCTVCNAELTEKNVYPALGHKEIILPAKAATCTENGLTEGKTCTECKEDTVKQEEIASPGHAELILSAKDADCTEDGITAGVKCSICGENIKAQQVIPALGHKDENYDELCDNCGEYIKLVFETLPLIENGKLKVQIVIDPEILDYNAGLEVHPILALRKALKDAGIDLVTVDDVAGNEEVFEILVGDIESRGEKYHYDYRALGHAGKAVEMIGTKIIVAGGNEESLIMALNTFIENVFISSEDISNVVFDINNKSHCYVNPTNPKVYAWKSVTVAGNDLRDYVIAADLSYVTADEKLYKEAALFIQNEFYENSGYWIPILDTSASGAVIPEKAIVFKHNSEFDEGYEGYKAYVDGARLVFETAFPNKLREKLQALVYSFISESITAFEIDSDYSAKEDLRFVSYEDFGAKGDGKTNDYKAMYDTHVYANKYGHTVKAKSGKNYYIGKLNGGSSIPITTDVIWTGATITIDDSDIAHTDSDRTKSVFRVPSDYSGKTYGQSSEFVQAIMADGGLKTTTEKISYSLGYDALIIPYNKNHKVYIRYGTNENAGSDQHEVIVIDKDGNIDKDTPPLLDYETVTSVVVYRIDDKPITIDGGLLVTVANRAPTGYRYYNRNIAISRSNVTIKNMSRKIVGEGDYGAPYSGFISPSYLNNLLVENCTFQAHRSYLNTDPTTGGRTQMGTYELGGSNANKLYYKNCKQSNFYNYKSTTVNTGRTWYDMDTGEEGTDNGSGGTAYCWGVMGTNYCKNITYDGCELNRFDAHAGVYNATVKDTKIIDINLIGGGTATIENSTVYNNYALTLRNDYGSTWHGDIIIDNVTIVPRYGTAGIVNAIWANWYFGYTTYLPNITLNNVRVGNDPSAIKDLNIFSSFASEDFYADRVSKDADIYPDDVDENGKVPNLNKPELPEYIKVSNCPNVNIYVAPSGSPLADKIEITYLEVKD